MTSSGIKNRQGDAVVQAIRSSFFEVEELQESARHWDLDFRQLDPGLFRGELELVLAAHVHIGWVQLDRCIEQTGTPPLGMRTIAVPASAGTRVFWRGRPVDGQYVLVYPRGSEIDAISQPGFDMFVLSFSDEVLSRAGEAVGISNPDRLLDASDGVKVDPRLLQALRADLTAWFGAASTPGQRRDHRWSQEDLPASVLRLLAGAPSPRAAPAVPRMDLAIRQVRAHVAIHPFDALKVGDLSKLTGVSERTLRHSFRARLGLSAKAYLRDRRLNLVRRELLWANAATTRVGDVATRWGFSHMSQFAADYRRLFGELPSRTAARCCTADTR